MLSEGSVLINRCIVKSYQFGVFYPLFAVSFWLKLEISVASSGIDYCREKSVQSLK